MRCQSACYNKLKMSLYVDFDWEMAVWERKEKKYNKKTLIRKGPNSSSILELIINLSKNLDVSFVVI
jgi:hypothetical protein